MLFQLKYNAKTTPIAVCRVCSRKIGEQPSNSNIHRAKCNARMKCAVCGATFREVGNRKIKTFCTHVMLCAGEGIFKCPKCPLQGTDYKTIYRHSKDCEKNVKCRACNVDNFLYPQQLYDHIAQEHPKIQCTICKQVFMLHSQLDEHMASAHE